MLRTSHILTKISSSFRLRPLPPSSTIMSSSSNDNNDNNTGNKKVLLCGGGNAIHVLTSYIGSRPDCDVSILTTFPGEADRMRDAIPDEGIRAGTRSGGRCASATGPRTSHPDRTSSSSPYPPSPTRCTSGRWRLSSHPVSSSGPCPARADSICAPVTSSVLTSSISPICSRSRLYLGLVA